MENNEYSFWRIILTWFIMGTMVCIFCSCQREKVITKVVTDTITISNTIKEPVHDTIVKLKDRIVKVETTNHDTVEVFLPIEQKVYKDSFYTAYVSGNNVKLDSISVETMIVEKVIEKTQVVKEKAKRKPWGIGIQGGYGINKEPYIGIGLSYNLINF